MAFLIVRDRDELCQLAGLSQFFANLRKQTAPLVRLHGAGQHFGGYPASVLH
jgi:hypothetical protein